MMANILLYLAVVFAPPLAVWLLLRGIRLGRSIADRRRTAVPPFPPIEQLAADLCRVHRALIELPPNAPALRRRAAEQAYDELLATACDAVGVDHRLDAAATRMDREIERLRVEQALRDSGLRIP